ncbi:MAG: lipoate--protein ligase family protein [Verrucomicrobia bacterium]|nr:lipoate--protein ligase family protein [Verrucomicrobiota bacterium]
MTSVARLLLDGASSPARNMAVDEALLRHVKSPVLRIYGWDVDCVSIGYFQKAAVASTDRPFVRRYTGGGLVEHGRDLTYTLVLPSDHPLTTAGTLPSYRSIHEAVAQALEDCGVQCRLATAQPQKDDASCFLKPVPADVLNSEGNKLAGAAQRRTRQGCLHQGSILLPQVIPATLPKNLTIQLQTCLQVELRTSTLSPDEEKTCRELESSRYGLKEWNFSR